MAILEAIGGHNSAPIALATIPMRRRIHTPLTKPLPDGVDPIWHVAANDPRASRFISASGAFQT
jgi:hypothetical protein